SLEIQPAPTETRASIRVATKFRAYDKFRASRPLLAIMRLDLGRFDHKRMRVSRAVHWYAASKRRLFRSGACLDLRDARAKSEAHLRNRCRGNVFSSWPGLSGPSPSFLRYQVRT